MKKKNNKKKFLDELGLIVNIVLTAIVTVFCIILTENLTSLYPDNEEILFLFLALIILYIGIYLQTIIHEAGHLIFGLISGYKFSSFRIGSIMILKNKKGFKLKTLTLSGTGGQCLMTPPEPVDDQIPVILYNFGGAILNIITSIIFLILFILFKDNAIVAYIFEIFAIFGLYFAALNGIPMKMGIINNDGFNAISLSKNKEAQRAFWIQLKTNELLTNNTRIKDLPKEWFTLPKDADLNNPMIITLAVYECNKLIDEHEFKKANKKMEELLKKETAIVGLHKNLLICDRIYCELLEGNIEQAKKLYNTEQKKFMDSMKNYPSVIRTNYAIALLMDKDKKTADNYLKLFRKRRKTYPYPSDMKSERELISIATNFSKN